MYGGWTNDFQDYDTCGKTRYNGSDNIADYARDAELPVEPAAALAADDRIPQPLAARLGPAASSDARAEDRRHLFRVEQARRRSLAEVRRRLIAAPRRRPSRTTRVARVADLQCNGNLVANCADNRIVPGTAGPGQVPYRAELYRDALRNSVWWSYNGYIQDSFSRGKCRANGGLRYDWQHSKYNGGCVPENVIRPDLLPAQCEEATQSGINPNTGQMEKIRPFGNWSPRLSVTYDPVRRRQDGPQGGRVGYYYKTRETLADNLSGLFR